MFKKSTIKFLRELEKNNNRDWFEANKHRYESDVREPALAYIEAMAPQLAKISGGFVASPKKVGGSLMRVYRDVRFSKDKTPYKTNIGIQFRHVAGKDVHAPGFYMHIEPADVFLAAGIWRPDSPTLQNVRMQLDENPAAWKKIRSAVERSGYTLQGESLKRPPRGYSDDHPLLEDLKRKDFIAVQNLSVSSVSQSDFVSTTAKLFAKSKPLVKFICEANDLEF
ncbi:TIGR02453 family protein [Chromatiales bacterium (ex Bugula neritina AB1)]|nr:TIGR02453 family protein [Chromatiales bacterium (ex Bugula neritina AB1)]